MSPAASRVPLRARTNPGSERDLHSPEIDEILSSPGRQDAPMINGKRITVVTPAHNAEKTLEETVRELPGHRRYQDYSWKIRALIKPCASRRAWA